MRAFLQTTLGERLVVTLFILALLFIGYLTVKIGTSYFTIDIHYLVKIGMVAVIYEALFRILKRFVY